MSRVMGLVSDPILAPFPGASTDTGTGNGTGALPLDLDLIRGVRRPRELGGDLVDLRLADGHVVEVTATGALPVNHLDRTLDLTDAGWLALTAPAEPHAHLDKALSYDEILPPHGDLPSAVIAWRDYVETATTESILARARRQALAMLANGITAVRTHADVHAGFPTRSALALTQLRDEFAGLMDIQIVALCSWHAAPEEIHAALDTGLDLLGGAPHMAADPHADLQRLIEIATVRDLPLDLHTDENLDGPLTLDRYADLVAPHIAKGHVCAASHCVRLGTLTPTEQDRVIDAVKQADLGIVSLPITNLYLQGWDHPQLTPRGLTALKPLLDAGVRVGAGADNVRDPFNPVGRSCAFETASLLVSAGHLAPELAYRLVAEGARDVMGLEPAGPIPGARAELLLVRADSVTEAVAEGPAERLVIHRGRLVAATQLHRRVAAPSLSATHGVP